MKIGLIIFFNILLLAEVTFAQIGMDILPLDKPLLADQRLQAEVATFRTQLIQSDEGSWMLEDRRRVKELCAFNCYCFATKLQNYVLGNYPYRVSLIRLLPLQRMTMLDVLDGSKRGYHYHDVLLIEDSKSAMIVDPIIFHHTKGISVRQWIANFGNFKISKPFANSPE